MRSRVLLKTEWGEGVNELRKGRQNANEEG